MKSPNKTAIVSKVPGEYKNSQSELILSKPKIPVHEKLMAEVKKLLSGPNTLEARSIKITKIYGDQAANKDIELSSFLISLVEVVHGFSKVDFGNKILNLTVTIAKMIVKNGVKIDTNS